VSRTLLVLRGPIDAESIRASCQAAASGPGELAVCRLLPEGGEALKDALSAQRAISSVLRCILGARAEDVAVFVASRREGDRVEDCARLWGATTVVG